VTDLATYLRPAFIAGAIFLLIVGAGVLVMVRLRFHKTDPDGRGAARDLRNAGVVVVVFGLAVAATATWLISSVGPWVFAVPGALIADGLAFIQAGRARARL
jgi:hypothetical protein